MKLGSSAGWFKYQVDKTLLNSKVLHGSIIASNQLPRNLLSHQGLYLKTYSVAA